MYDGNMPIAECTGILEYEVTTVLRFLLHHLSGPQIVLHQHKMQPLTCRL